MPPTPITFNGGKVTSKSPTLLTQNEMTEARDAYYKPGDPAIWEALGRSTFNATPESGPMRGLVGLQFQDAPTLLVAAVGTSYRKATLGDTGTFSDLVTGLSGGDTLTSLRYDNQHLLMNGVDRIRVVDSTGAVTFLGMTPNAAPPTILRDGPGPYGGFTLPTGYTMQYWVEERVKVGSLIVKRNISSATEVAILTGDNTLDKPRITRPAIVNSDATHWALYATAANSSFPTGAEIAEVVIATTFIDDSRSTTNLPAGDIYEIISATIAGVSQNVPKFAPPPVASLATVFEDSILLNDTSDTSRLTYSYYDEIHAYPSFNEFAFPEDDVVYFARVGAGVVVGLKESLWRINSFPRPEDGGVQPERAKDQIDGAPGMVGPLAACLFSFGLGLRLAYVSTAGLCVTDGANWTVLTSDIDWKKEIDVGGLSSSVLINNTTEFRLELYASTPSGGRAGFYFYYHPSHSKQGEEGFRTKATWPISNLATCATRVFLGGVPTIFTGHADGKVYKEGGSLTDESASGGIRFKVTGGANFVNGLGGEGTVRNGYVHHNAAPGRTIVCTLTSLNEGEQNYDQKEIVEADTEEATSLWKETLTERAQVSFEGGGSGPQLRLDFYALDVEEMGDSSAHG